VSYSQEVVALLMAIWEAAGYPWSVRLKALLPLWMPLIRKRYRLQPEMERQLLQTNDSDLKTPGLRSHLTPE
jgi:hypothetical protein